MIERPSVEKKENQDLVEGVLVVRARKKPLPKGIEEGDFIFAINKQAITTIFQLNKQTKREGAQEAELYIFRQGKTVIIKADITSFDFLTCENASILISRDEEDEFKICQEGVFRNREGETVARFRIEMSDEIEDSSQKKDEKQWRILKYILYSIVDSTEIDLIQEYAEGIPVFRTNGSDSGGHTHPDKRGISLGAPQSFSGIKTFLHELAHNWQFDKPGFRERYALYDARFCMQRLKTLHPYRAAIGTLAKIKEVFPEETAGIDEEELYRVLAYLIGFEKELPESQHVREDLIKELSDFEIMDGVTVRDMLWLPYYVIEREADLFAVYNVREVAQRLHIRFPFQLPEEMSPSVYDFIQAAKVDPEAGTWKEFSLRKEREWLQKTAPSLRKNIDYRNENRGKGHHWNQEVMRRLKFGPSQESHARDEVKSE